MARRSKKMSESELLAIVDRQITDARNFAGSDSDQHREWALKFFEGKVDFDAEKGRSTVVSRDVADTHGFILPGLLRVFFASDRVGIFEPTRPHVQQVQERDDKTGQPMVVEKDVSEDLASQATDYVNYVLLRECNGYRHVRDAFSDGLLLGNGPMKHWWDDSREYSTESYTGLTDAEYRLVLNDPDIEEETEHKEYPDPNWQAPPEEVVLLATAMGQPEPQPPMLYDCTIKRVKSYGRLRISALPPEEFLIERNAKVVDETVRFCAHVQRKTRSDLIKDGYSRDRIDDLPTFAGVEDNTQTYRDDTALADIDEAPDQSTELVDVFECYVLVDFDGDGIAERRKVVVAGHVGERGLLENEDWGDDLPFSDIVPEPRPHARRGRGLYDEMADIQRVKTVCLRGILDNTYQVLYPQKIVNKTQVEATSWGEIVNPTWGGTIWASDVTAVKPVEVQHIAPQIAPVMEYMDQVGTRRTGASDQTEALDANVLNETATKTASRDSARYAKIEEYARNIAEFGGMKRLFSSCLKLICKHQDRAKMIRLRGEFVEMDPRGWDADMDVTINVGLGTGSRDRDLAMLQGVAGKQEQVIMQAGPLNEWVNVGHLFDTYRKMAEAAGLKNADSFFPDVSQDDIAKMREAQKNAPPPPDPKVVAAMEAVKIKQMSAQADQQRKMAESQANIQLVQQRNQAEIQGDREKNAMDLAAMREKNAMDLQAMREKHAAELQMAEEKQAAEIEMREREMNMEFALTREANMMNAAVAANRPADTNIRGPQQ